jgi:hypothetical protein
MDSLDSVRQLNSKYVGNPSLQFSFIFSELKNESKSRFTDYLTCLTATIDTSPFLSTLYQFKASETITFTTLSQQLITNYLQEYKIYTCLLKKILIQLESKIFANEKALVFILKCNNTEL